MGPRSGGTEISRDTADTKQKARWFLKLAREQIFKQQLDAAEQSLAQAAALNVEWGFFDDTPEKVAGALAKARAKAGTSPPQAGAAAGPAPVRNRRTARARLREARAALASNRIDQTDMIVDEIRSWGLRFGPFEDTPDKVAASVAEARSRQAIRDSERMVQSYLRSDAIQPMQARSPSRRLPSSRKSSRRARLAEASSNVGPCEHWPGTVLASLTR